MLTQEELNEIKVRVDHPSVTSVKPRVVKDLLQHIEDTKGSKASEPAVEQVEHKSMETWYGIWLRDDTDPKPLAVFPSKDAADGFMKEMCDSDAHLHVVECQGTIVRLRGL